MAMSALISHVKMDSDRPVGYFRIEMSDSRRMFFPIIRVRVAAESTDQASVRVGLIQVPVQ